MFDFHEKRKIRGVLYSKPVFILLILIAALLSMSVYNRLIVAQGTKERLDEKREDLEALQIRADVLQEKVDYLEDERGIEEELRNRFDVAKEGEQVVIILEEREKQSHKQNPQAQPEEVEEEGMFRSVMNLLKFW